MPIRLSLSDVAGSPLAGRLVFLVDTTGVAITGLANVLRRIDGCHVPAVGADLWANGMSHVFGNYLSASHVGGGLAALCDDATFLAAVRALADDLYGSVLDVAGGDALVDTSLGNAIAPQVIEAVYPDALIVVVEDAPDDVTSLLVSPNVVRVAPAQLRDEIVLLALLRDALEHAHQQVARTSPSSLRAPRASLPAPPLFVVGCPRSGTTWLQGLLATHPSIGGPAKETAAFVSVQALLGNEALAAWVTDFELHGAIRRFLEGLFAVQLASQPGATRFLEKTPIHARHLDTIASLFPKASVIGIHRDGRDVVRSLVEVEAGASSVAEAAEWWVSMTAAVAAFAHTNAMARDERYEDLLANPVPCVVELLEWLGLPPNPTVVNEIRARVDTRVSQYNTTGDVGSGKWHDTAPSDLRTIVRIAGDRLVAMGYMTSAELRDAEQPAIARALTKAIGYFRPRARRP